MVSSIQLHSAWQTCWRPVTGCNRWLNGPSRFFWSILASIRTLLFNCRKNLYRLCCMLLLLLVLEKFAWQCLAGMILARQALWTVRVRPCYILLSEGGSPMSVKQSWHRRVSLNWMPQIVTTKHCCILLQRPGWLRSARHCCNGTILSQVVPTIAKDERLLNMSRSMGIGIWLRFFESMSDVDRGMC